MFPTKHIFTIRLNNRRVNNNVRSIGTEKITKNINIPSFGTWNPQVPNYSRVREIRALDDKMIMYVLPNMTPRGTPNRNITINNLIEAGVFNMMPYLE